MCIYYKSAMLFQKCNSCVAETTSTKILILRYFKLFKITSMQRKSTKNKQDNVLKIKYFRQMDVAFQHL